MENLLSTKFIYAMFGVALAFVLVLMGNLTGEQFTNFVEILGASYILGNVISKFAPTDIAK
jgi:hypothetical protein